ncbi:hypothetical protein ASPSYDRAFT_38336 [Aspergillus sydowii CBS 593.65]|uniref:Uncharacterized protein n=1 Tax=Aspergillus sydowii CBS 593.65 TaxID=1036612 RepID=A0A1L9TW99_9EURO|nr:uncharacterized protein ASPSYDRAFT_38336 [Aspergillus sydowii CBS 593.65]OJJ63709.1 hypothetical protein ASPSYDRAFT_38336 [Aspergillus sydowii CBS 593.65]
MEKACKRRAITRSALDDVSQRKIRLIQRSRPLVLQTKTSSNMNWYAMSRRHSRARYTIVMNCVLSLLFLASDI